MAYWRMLETRRSHTPHAPSPSLIQDEFAPILLDNLASPELLQQFQSSPFLPIGLNFLAIRTRIIDDWLLEKSCSSSSSSSSNSKRRGRRQVVNLGAGMCTRPYRLDLPKSTTIYEVECHGELLHTKHEVLQDAGYKPSDAKVISVEGNVADMDALCEILVEKHGLDPSLPTDWIAEGLFAYLKPLHHLQVLERARHFSGKDSRFIVTLVHPYCQQHVLHVLGVKLPWAELRPIADFITEMKHAGWSKNLQVLGDKDFMAMFQRTVTLPIFLVSAESNPTNPIT
jgi:methyltransferase (TIGR00027 family)